MKTITCKQCEKSTRQLLHGTSLFCNQKCYFKWKRKHPNKRAYKEKISVSGYYYLYMPEHPNAINKGRYIAEHRYNLEQKIGRFLKKNEVAHHINGDKKDNRQENLEVLKNMTIISDKERELVIARMEILPSELHFSSGNSVTLTRDAVIKHIKDNDELGKEFVKMELDFLRALKSGDLMKRILTN